MPGFNRRSAPLNNRAVGSRHGNEQACMPPAHVQDARMTMYCVASEAVPVLEIAGSSLQEGFCGSPSRMLAALSLFHFKLAGADRSDFCFCRPKSATLKRRREKRCSGDSTEVGRHEHSAGGLFYSLVWRLALSAGRHFLPIDLFFTKTPAESEKLYIVQLAQETTNGNLSTVNRLSDSKSIRFKIKYHL
eukprot:6212949-Pleurochrysis_carterae.AAC.2